MDGLEVGRDYMVTVETDGEQIEEGPFTYRGSTGMLDHVFYVFQSPAPGERRKFVLPAAVLGVREV